MVELTNTNRGKGGSLMTDSPTSKMRFETPAKLVLEAAFDGGRLTSDGGLHWISEVDLELGVCLRSRT